MLLIVNQQALALFLNIISTKLITLKLARMKFLIASFVLLTFNEISYGCITPPPMCPTGRGLHCGKKGYYIKQ